MASTDPLIDLPDAAEKFRRTQQTLAASTKSYLLRAARARFGRSLGLLAALTRPAAEAGAEAREVHEVWEECLEQDFSPPALVFRSSMQKEPYCYMSLFEGANVALTELLYKPAETAVWRVFVEHMLANKGQQDNAVLPYTVVMPFGVRRSKLPWILSNLASLNDKLKRPLQTYLAVPSQMDMPEVLILPLRKPEGESDAE